MDNMEVMKEIRTLTGEVRLLRAEVMRLRLRTKEDDLKGQWLTMQEACEYLRISRNTMQRRLTEGDIDFAVKRGKSWKFPADRLKQYASGC